MAQEIIYLTAEGYKKIKDELEHMRSVERPAISAAIAEARDKGDLSENAEYDAAREAQGLLEMRIAKLEDTMANARVIDESKIDKSKVQIFEQGDASEPQQSEADDLHDRRRARGESARRQAGDRHAYREGAAGPQEGRPCGRGGSGRHDPFRDPRHQHLNRPAFSGGVRFPRGVPDRTYTLICRYFCRGRLSRSLFFVSSPP